MILEGCKKYHQSESGRGVTKTGSPGLDTGGGVDEGHPESGVHERKEALGAAGRRVGGGLAERSGAGGAARYAEWPRSQLALMSLRELGGTSAS
jgi:hypothetical protein